MSEIDLSALSDDELKAEYKRRKGLVDEAVSELFRCVQEQDQREYTEGHRPSTMSPVGWLLVTQAYGVNADGDEFDDSTLEWAQGTSMFAALGLATTAMHEIRETVVHGEEPNDE